MNSQVQDCSFLQFFELCSLPIIQSRPLKQNRLEENLFMPDCCAKQKRINLFCQQLKFKMMEQDSEQQQMPCIICNENNEQMLMLSCIHDPCINCAAKHYVETEPEDSNIYTCQKCGQETELDDSSIIELRKIYNLNKRKKKEAGRFHLTPSVQMARGSPLAEQANRKNQPEPQLKRKDRQDVDKLINPKKIISPQMPQPNYQPSTKKINNGLQFPCRDHPQEQLTYFCFSCSQPICPQCAIHGAHKDHEMETTRKAIKKIRTLLAESKQKLQVQTKGLIESRENGKQQVKVMADENRTNQDHIKKRITHLKNVLSEKQKELLRAAQANFEKNLQRIKQEDVLADKIFSQISNVNRNIDSTMKKQELVILQEYNLREEEVHDLLQRADQNKDRIIDYQQKNPPKIINLNLLDEDIDRFLTEIYSLKLTTMVEKSAYNN